MAGRPALWQRAYLMNRGDIFLVSLDPTPGHEQKGTRPVLVISPFSFNRVTKAPIVLPITSGSKFARTTGFAVSLDSCGTKTKGIVRCDQPRVIDFEARAAHYLESAPDEIVEDVRARVAAIFF